MHLIDGKALAESIRAKLPARIKKLSRPPGLGVMLVGDNAASALYVRRKRLAAEEAGIRFALSPQAADVNQSRLLEIIDHWNNDAMIDGILIQLPLPSSLREQEIVEQMRPEKDADGFHPVNIAQYLGGERIYPPGLVEGIEKLIFSTGVVLDDMTGVIVAKESVFSQCLEHALALRGVLSRTVAPDGHHHNATVEPDIVIIAAGQAGLLKGDDVKPGAIVIDVGINTNPDGRVVGDVDPSVHAVAGWITPVPGGVGPMTIAMLLENVVRIAERNQQAP